MGGKTFLGNCRFFYFDGDGKIELYYIQKQLWIKIYIVFVKFAELNWNGMDCMFLYS